MKKILLILLLLFYATYTMAQITLHLDNGKNNEVVGLVNLMDDSRILSFIKDEKAQINIDIDRSSLFALGYKGELYFLFGESGREYHFDCSSKKIIGLNEQIVSFLDSWKENYFEIPQNNLANTLRSLVVQNPKKESNIETEYLLSKSFLVDLKKSYKNQNKFLKKNGSKNEEFKMLFSDYIYRNYWSRLISVATILRNRGERVPERILDEILNMEVNEPFFLSKSYDISWLSAYIKALEDKGKIKPSLKDYVFKTAMCFKNENVREVYTLSELDKKIKQNNLIYFEDLCSTSISCVVTEKGKNKFKSIYEEGMLMLSKNDFDGKQAEDLIFFTLDGEKVRLSDFKGKYVYIDIWATWCKPCKYETPYFIKLSDRMKGKNIVFLSLSVDNENNEQKWKDYIAMHSMQEYCTVGWTGCGLRNFFIKYYKIRGIPQFMLVGPDGTMIYNNCWRPSNIQIDELLNSFLN